MKYLTLHTSFLLSVLFLLLFSQCSDSNDSPSDDPPEVEVDALEITFLSPELQAEIEIGSQVEIKVEVSALANLNFVRFYIDGVEVYSKGSAPFTYMWDTSSETLDQHSIKVEAVNKQNKVTSESLTVTVVSSKKNIVINGSLKDRLTLQAIEGYNLLLGETSSITDENGDFSFIDFKTDAETASIYSNPMEDYISIQYGFDTDDEMTLSPSLYAYPKPSNIVVQGNEFIKGISLFDAGPWMSEDLYPEAFKNAFSRLEDINANTVTMFDPVFVTVVGEDSVKMETSAPTSYSWDMISNNQYTDLSRDAASKNVDMMYWFGVWPQEEKRLGTKGFNEIVFSGQVLSDDFWEDWFNEYTKILINYATLAQSNGVPYLSLGHGLSYATAPAQFSSENLYHNLWTKLISDIRAVFNGQIFYFGASRPFTTQNYSGGNEVAYSEDEGYTSTFVNLFDALGIVVSNITEIQNPTPAQVKTDFATILTRYETFNKPLLLWIWAPSVDGAANNYGHLEPVLAVNRDADNFTTDYYEQADIYQGLFEAVNESSVDIKGVFSHGYMYYDRFEMYTPRNMETAFQKSASIRNKPAEEIVSYWFKNW